MLTSSPAVGYGSGLISTPSTTPKIAVLAPMPTVLPQAAVALDNLQKSFSKRKNTS
jgi:hypothetical protein